MPILTPGGSKQISVLNGNGEPQGERTQFFYEDEKGIPRRDDLMTVRQLEKTHTISIPMDTIKTQLATTPFGIRPTVDSPSTDHHEAADDIEDRLRGNYNRNKKPFDHLVKQWGHDVISIDTGIIEKVPNENGFLSELYNRDGATFTKNLDAHGRLPEPGGDVPAYWQFSLAGAMRRMNPETPLRDIAEEQGAMGYGIRARDPVGFSRDQVIWTEVNPAPWRTYGFGMVQKARRLAEIVLNQDLSNKAYFHKNEIPDGLLNVVEANQSEINQFREYWQDEVKGKEHVMPIVGGHGSDMEWIPFRPTPDELEFMASQKWYNQLVWMAFGLNQGEVGDIENINRATMEKQAENVFRQTTKPLLDTLANDFNAQILPHMEEYLRVDGELEFYWEIDNPAMERLERQKQREDLNAGLTTPNEIRTERGKEELPWGDLPLPLVNSVARSNPGWALEQWGDVPPEEAPSDNPMGMLSAYGGETGDAQPTETENVPELEEADSGNPNIPERYREAIKTDSLRDEEWEWQYPPLSGHADALASEIASVFEDAKPEIEELIEEEFPEEELDPAFGIPPSLNVIDELDLTQPLREAVVSANIKAMEIAAEFHAEELEEELEKRFSRKDEPAAIEISFDVTDTFAAERLERIAASRMVTVSETVKGKIRDTLLSVAEDGGNVSEATDALDERFEELTRSHSRLVARTETMDSSRQGSTALGEATDLVGGKQWNSSGDPDDGRTRPWHSAMNEEIVPVDEKFTVPADPSWQGDPHYQPSDYPRSVHTVGEDQPFNCRCDQRLIPTEDMPGDLESLSAMENVTVRRLPKDSGRMREILKENARSPEEDLGDVIERALIEAGSVNKGCEQLGISTATMYDWGELLGIEQFSR